MNQNERRRYLIEELLKEQPAYQGLTIASDAHEQERQLRALLNVRQPGEISKAFLQVQDDYLTEAIREKGIVRLTDLSPLTDGLYLWQGDITRLAVDAIVNAANSGLTGCYQPNHNCIDNCIHTYSGVQLRLACAKIMAEQGHEEPTGQAKITPAYNLPSKYILHTVGPIIATGQPSAAQQAQLAACYRSCLELAAEHGCQSIAFCCISTGVFRFPNQLAAEIAINTVKQYQQQTDSPLEVVFNVFKETDWEIYRRLLG